MKRLGKLLLVLVLLLAVLVAGLFLALDRIAEAAVEKGATQAAGVATEVDDVDVGVTSNELSMGRLTMANPPGFSDDGFIALGRLDAQWEGLGALTGDEIRIERIVLDGVRVHLERKGGKTNYGVVLENLGRSGGEEPPSSEPGKRFRVGELRVRDVRASLAWDGLGDVEVEVPEIVLRDLDSQGDTKALASKLTRVLIQALLEGTLKAGQNVLPDELVKDLGRGLEDLADEIGEHAEKGLEELERGVEGVLEGAGKALEAPGKLFEKRR
jgi:hypothetical protein